MMKITLRETELLTADEAEARARGCQPMMEVSERAMLAIDETLAEIARLHVRWQIWLAADGQRVAHYALGVPSMGVVFVGEGDMAVTDFMDSARAEITDWMAARLGRALPPQATLMTTGGWFEAVDWLVGRRPVPHLRADRHDDVGAMILRGWRTLRASELAAGGDGRELALADATHAALDVGGAIPLEQAKHHPACDHGTRGEAVGFGVDDHQEAAVQVLRARDHGPRGQAVGGAETVGRRVALGPQLSLLAPGEDDVERGPEGFAHQVRPAGHAAVLAELDRRLASLRVSRDRSGRSLVFDIDIAAHQSSPAQSAS